MAQPVRETGRKPHRQNEVHQDREGWVGRHDFLGERLADQREHAALLDPFVFQGQLHRGPPAHAL